MEKLKSRYTTLSEDHANLTAFVTAKNGKLVSNDEIWHLIGRAEARLSYAKEAIKNGAVSLATTDLDKAFTHQARAWSLARKG